MSAPCPPSSGSRRRSSAGRGRATCDGVAVHLLEAFDHRTHGELVGLLLGQPRRSARGPGVGEHLRERVGQRPGVAGGTSRPVLPSTTMSRMPPEAAATTAGRRPWPRGQRSGTGRPHRRHDHHAPPSGRARRPSRVAVARSSAPWRNRQASGVAVRPASTRGGGESSICRRPAGFARPLSGRDHRRTAAGRRPSARDLIEDDLVGNEVRDDPRVNSRGVQPVIVRDRDPVGDGGADRRGCGDAFAAAAPTRCWRPGSLRR